MVTAKRQGAWPPPCDHPRCNQPARLVTPYRASDGRWIVRECAGCGAVERSK